METARRGPGANARGGTSLSTFLLRRAREAIHGRRELRRLLQNVALDLRYGGRLLGGVVESEFRFIGYVGTENTAYDVFPRLFAGVPVSPDDVIVDVGCGRGRLMNWLLHRRLGNRIIGIEVNRSIAASTRGRLRRYPQVTIVSCDVKDCFPDDGTIFYLYNPFGADTMEWFAERLEPLRRRGNGRRPIIVYYNALHVAPFEARGWRVRAIDLQHASELPAVVATP